jgi:hypothetical protein
VSDRSRPGLDAAGRVEDRRARREQLVFGAVSAVVIVTAGVVAALIVDPSGSGTSSAAREAVAPIITVGAAPSVESLPCRAPLTSDDPLRLWIGGDSLAGSLGPALGELAAASGVAAPVYDSRSGSGLSTPEFFDWPDHATTEMDRLDPEVVVFIMGTNDYATPSPSSDTTTSTTGEPAWREEYAARVEQMLRIFHGTTDRFVHWVGAPPLRDRRADNGVREINAVARAVVERDEHAAYFDEYALFASERGGYTATLPRAGKSDLRVRADDGVHFTEAGGTVLGEAVYDPIDRRCRLDDQAVAGATQRVIRVPGSTDRVSPSTTAPASTAPPTTQPTTTTTSTTTGDPLGTASTTLGGDPG